MVARVQRRTGVIVLVAALLAGCSMGAEEARTSNLKPVETDVPEGTADVRARPAVDAFGAFTRALARAQQRPIVKGGKFPVGSDISRYSFDPIRSEYEYEINGLAVAGLAYRGTPPQLALNVVSVDVNAVPWQKVTLSACQTGLANWNLISVATGAPAPARTGRISASEATTVVMIYRQGRWGVHTMVPDRSRDCARDVG